LVFILENKSLIVYNSKTYTTENAFRSHINSRKHKENELKIESKAQPKDSTNLKAKVDFSSPIPKPVALQIQSKPVAVGLTVEDNASEDEINQTIDEKIAAARSRLSSTHCLFCPEQYSSLADNLTHMSTTHSFFIPDAEYLIDLPGLIMYLGEKIAVGNVCIFCDGRGRDFRTLHAVRKHMLDKSHCKIAYSSENEKLEVSDFYDFSSSYPNPSLKKNYSKDVTDQWEDMEGDSGDGVDEIVDEEVIDEADDDSDTDSEESIPDNSITYGDSHLELVLPSGSRIGHRSMRRYYAQSFPRGRKPEDPNSGAALVRRLLADKNSALIPSGGGFGAFGRGTEVVRARNKGEAREAGRHIREFRDQKRREDFKTKVGFVGNHQKHYRDPCKSQ
jgi:pre-60S factor REI1